MHDYDGLRLLVGLYDIRQLRTSDFVIDKENICIYRYIYIVFFFSEKESFRQNPFAFPSPFQRKKETFSDFLKENSLNDFCLRKFVLRP